MEQRYRFRRDHRWARGRLSDYLDRGLAPARRGRMERHLGECAACRALLEGLEATVAALQRLSPPSGGVDPVELAAAVRVRLDPRP